LENEAQKTLEEIKKRLNQIWNLLVPLQRTGQELRNLRQIIEDKESLSPRFVESSPQIRTYGGRIDGVLRNGVGKNIYIMGYFDQARLDKLTPIARNLKIISPTGALKTKKNKDALKRISKAGAEVKTHPMLHARIFCDPDKRVLIVGSGDLQTDCFGGSRFDAGVWSNHPDLIKSAIDFFNRVWQESDPLQETSS